MQRSPEDFPADDPRRLFPKFSAAAFPRTLDFISLLSTIAASHSATPAQVAIAWVLAQGALPIPGSKQIAYADENFRASDVRLTDGEVRQIRDMAAEMEKNNEGARYPGAFQDQLLVETPALPST